MLIDCHVHSSRYSACSMLAPQKICDLAQKRGLDALVLTEHQVQWLRPELDQLQEANPELKIFSGVEVTLLEGYDVVVICENKGFHFNLGLSFKQLITELDLLQSPYFLFVAHPFRYQSDRPQELDQILAQVHGIEMNSVNILQGQARKDKDKYLPTNMNSYLKAQKDADLIALFNSDAHHKDSLGTIANSIEVPCLPENEVQLASLLKTHEIQEYQNSQLLTKSLGNFALKHKYFHF